MAMLNAACLHSTLVFLPSYCVVSLTHVVSCGGNSMPIYCATWSYRTVSISMSTLKGGLFPPPLKTITELVQLSRILYLWNYFLLPLSQGPVQITAILSITWHGTLAHCAHHHNLHLSMWPWHVQLMPYACKSLFSQAKNECSAPGFYRTMWFWSMYVGFCVHSP